MRRLLLLGAFVALAAAGCSAQPPRSLLLEGVAAAQTLDSGVKKPGAEVPPGVPVLLLPDRVFDGVDREAHEGWAVLVEGEKIKAAGPVADVKSPGWAPVIKLPGTPLLPGLIDAHAHVLLHPYKEAKWDERVLREPLALRVCRATNHLRAVLRSGFTTIRDLGTEGAG